MSANPYRFDITLLDSYNVDSVPLMLAGTWDNIGLYENNLIQQDTLYFIYSPEGDSLTTVVGIQTDSGRYEHFYSPEDKLVDINKVSLKDVLEFSFQADEKGIINQYEYDPALENKEHPRHQGFMEHFSLIKYKSGVVIEFHKRDGTVSHAGIKQITDKVLELQWTKDVIEKYNKIKLAPTTE